MRETRRHTVEEISQKTRSALNGTLSSALMVTFKLVCSTDLVTIHVCERKQSRATTTTSSTDKQTHIRIHADTGRGRERGGWWIGEAVCLCVMCVCVLSVYVRPSNSVTAHTHY